MFTRSDRLRPNTKFSRLSGTESVKSFVDDFDMEQGIVSARVGLSYDSLRLSPCSGDLWETAKRADKCCLKQVTVVSHPLSTDSQPIAHPNTQRTSTHLTPTNKAYVVRQGQLCDLQTQGKLWEARNEAELNDNNAPWWENIKTAIPECKSLDLRAI